MVKLWVELYKFANIQPFLRYKNGNFGWFNIIGLYFWLNMSSKFFVLETHKT